MDFCTNWDPAAAVWAVAREARRRIPAREEKRRVERAFFNARRRRERVKGAEREFFSSSSLPLFPSARTFLLHRLVSNSLTRPAPSFFLLLHRARAPSAMPANVSEQTRPRSHISSRAFVRVLGGRERKRAIWKKREDSSPAAFPTAIAKRLLRAAAFDSLIASPLPSSLRRLLLHLPSVSAFIRSLFLCARGVYCWKRARERRRFLEEKKGEGAFNVKLAVVSIVVALLSLRSHFGSKKNKLKPTEKKQPEQIYTLVSADGENYAVPEKIAKMSKTVENTINGKKRRKRRRKKKKEKNGKTQPPSSLSLSLSLRFQILQQTCPT